MASRNAPVTLRVHSLAQAVAVLQAAAEAGRTVHLVLGDYLGWAACAALRDAAVASMPAAKATWLYDPGGRAGLAAVALRQGAPNVVWPARDKRYAALAALAKAAGGQVAAPPRIGLDLAGSKDPLRAVQDYLSSKRRHPALRRTPATR